MPKPRRIISGGQTGADRGGLDAAIELGIPHGGWCPKGRRSEDGKIPTRYKLKETSTSSYADRTKRNVLAADATAVFTRGPAEGGSALTLELAAKHGKPFLHLDLLALREARAVDRLRAWLAETGAVILNVAGSREGSSPGLRERVWRIIKTAYARA